MADAAALARQSLNLVGAFFEGDLFIRVQDANAVWGKRIGPINSTQLGINPGEGESVNRNSRLRGQAGQILDSVFQPGSPSIALAFDDAGRELFTLALRGEQSTINEAGGSRVDQVTAVSHLGGWLQLPDRNIQVAGFSGKHANDTALVEDTDFVLQANMLQYGLVWIPANSSITAAEGCKWSYTYLGTTGTQIAGNRLDRTVIEAELLGKNKATAEDVRVLCREAIVSPGNEVNFMSDEFLSIDFSGSLKTPTGQSEPYIIETLTFATS